MHSKTVLLQMLGLVGLGNAFLRGVHIPLNIPIPRPPPPAPAPAPRPPPAPVVQVPAPKPVPVPPVPPVTVTAPPVTVTAPPVTVTAPPATVTAPPVTVTAPPATVTVSQCVAPTQAAVDVNMCQGKDPFLDMPLYDSSGAFKCCGPVYLWNQGGALPVCV
ncbi:hypothetical protein PFICI_11963 [Pestalotiopsis fici W106-1]|uniref:Hydrophobin n=1 Tax=Pestalotiopsis fici (strain W106-1 / CGMCC3.15140) TaxID=1229662 RepID=W3WUN3_PESFW|nr:uncharacterized protein PFICI_11963 [Pestalotiopsis fici W106-1]ETS76576.1 hypothetical protein PFICI_11963 [Pestalotiopsis fici W106-1]